MSDINGYSIDLAETIQDVIFKNGTSPGLASLWCALYTTIPATDGTGGVEVSGNNYSRVEVPVASWNDASTTAEVTKTDNLSAITFPEAIGGGWGIVAGFGLLTAVSAGTLRVGGALTTPKDISENTIAVFLAGNLIVNTVNQA